MKTRRRMADGRLAALALYVADGAAPAPVTLQAVLSGLIIRASGIDVLG
jgi:hypothetical protein